jgi:hypothetical protein
MAERRASDSGEEVQRTIERALDASSLGAVRPSAGPRTAGDLHICPACASELVYPLDWEPAGRERWRVKLRCPDCEWHGGGIYEQPVLDRFDETLDVGTDAVLEDFKAVVRANMEDEIDRFVAALTADQILPEDF